MRCDLNSIIFNADSFLFSTKLLKQNQITTKSNMELLDNGKNHNQNYFGQYCNHN